MKKAFLSLSLIFAFSAYAVYVRMTGTEAPVSLPVAGNNQSTKAIANTSLAGARKTVSAGKYKDGTYAGPIVDASYGNVQVEAIISGGRLIDVKFLDYPGDRQNSIRINSRAMPKLTSEAIATQDSNVNTVSGASYTSAAFRESLSGALADAKI